MTATVFFRACSVCLYGHQDNHTALRKAESFYAIEQSKNASKTECLYLSKLAPNTIRDNSWIGEDSILMTADYLRRPLHFYTFAGNSSPLIYASLISEVAAPIALAFYEPMHCLSIMDDAGLQLHHNLEALQRNPVNTVPPSTTLYMIRRGRHYPCLMITLQLMIIYIPHHF